MFWDILVELCNQKKTSPTAVIRELGIANGNVTRWKNGSIPRDTNLKRLADYFGVSVDYLLGKSEEKEKEPPAMEDGELEENMIVFHRNGKTQTKKFTKEQMAMLMAMVDAIPDTSSDDI